jgi:hypothetical protein
MCWHNLQKRPRQQPLLSSLEINSLSILKFSLSLSSNMLLDVLMYYLRLTFDQCPLGVLLAIKL